VDDVATSDDLAPTRARLSGRLVLLGMLGIIAIAVGVLVFAYVTRAKDPELRDLGTVPAFSLVDEQGHPFTEEGLRGHPTIVGFVFTRCDTVCPTLAMKLERMQEHLGDRKAEAIKIVTFSVDPGYDTPARLAEYAARYHADPTRWKFLTGPVDQVKALVSGPLMINMDRDGNTPRGTPNIAHEEYFLLIDGDLVIRGVYDARDIKKLDELEHHARYLARTGGDRPYTFGGS